MGNEDREPKDQNSVYLETSHLFVCFKQMAYRVNIAFH